MVAVKKLPADRRAPPDDGADVVKAFQAAHDNQELYGAIVTLAIAQYFGIHLRASEIASDTTRRRRAAANG